MSRIKSLFLITIVSAFVACNSSNTNADEYKAKPDNSLKNTQWLLININGKELLRGTRITLRFSRGIMGGSAGCNSYSSDYNMDESTIKIKELMRTSMGCEKPVGILQQESKYLKLLNSANGYKIEGEKLYLKKDEKKILVYQFIKPDKNVELENNKWKLITFILGEMATSTAEDSNISISFIDGKVKGWTACNRFKGTYTINGSKMAIKNIKMQKKPCNNKHLKENEDNFIRILKGISTFQIKGKRLSLHSRTGDGLDFSL